MSPEQVSGEPADARSDIFSLGCVLYEMLAGRRAFRGASPGQTMAAILRDHPPEIAASGVQVPEGLGRIVTRCLEKSPSERFHSARDLAFALRETAGGSAVSTSSPVVTRPRRPRVIAFVVVLAALAVVFFVFRDRLRPGAHKIESVAVLPLENLTGDASQEYFADGMTEELISDLSKISALRVPSRTSIMRYRKTTKSLPEIAKELGVDAVVEGSVSRNGSQVKVTAQLIDASKDKHLWADSFQRDLKDVLALQGEVARAIAQEVRAKLTPEEATHLAASRQVDPEAYEAYLQGRYFLYRRTSADLLKARDYFEKAISKDPEYALAYAGLADAYGLLGSASYSTLPPSETVPKVEAAVRKALELDPMLAEAHAGLAHISRDSATAEREFRRAIELDPKYAMGRQFYARFLVAHGRFDEAIREVKIGRDLDPLSLVGNTNVGFVLHFARRDDEAIEWCRKSLSMDPNFLLARWTLGMAYEQKKMYPEAIAEFEKARSLSKDGPAHVAALGHAYAVAGRVADARRCLEAMREMATVRFVNSDQIALIHVGLGEKDEAFTRLNQGEQERGNWLQNLAVDPRFDPLRSDPRFAELLQRLHLPVVPVR